MRRVNRLHWLVSVAVLAAQQATFILLLHHSRFAAASGGNRYIPSTVLLLCEVIKFTISLTGALYEISKPTNPTISVTSLFGALAHKVLCGDGWKLAIPATLYSIANTLVFTALFNLDPAAFQIAYQAQLIIGAIVAYALLRRTVDQERIASLVFLAVGMIVALWHKAKETNDNELDEKRLSTGPRSILEFKRVGTAMGGSFMKRSATYEGMDEDLIIAYPDMDTRLGLLAAVGAAAASAVAGSTLEAITGEIMDSTVMWVRNVQLSIFSMLAIGLYGVGSQDAEQIAKQGFFGGYDYVTWILIVLQASLGLCTAMCFASGQISRKATASRLSTAVVLLVSLRMHEFPDETMAIVGTGIVLVAIFLYGPLEPAAPPAISLSSLPVYTPIARDPSPRPHSSRRHEKAGMVAHEPQPHHPARTHLAPQPTDDRFLRIPTTPELERQGALSTSRPSSPMARGHHAKTGYFDS